MYYPSHNLLFNVHSLLHITDVAIRYKNLNNVSAYKFEKKIRLLKKLLKSNTNVIQQINKRTFEQYKAGHFPKRNILIDFIKSGKVRDNCFMLEGGSIVEIQSMENGNVCVRKNKKHTDFFEYPIKSGDLGIYTVKNLGPEFIVKDNNLIYKLYRIPYESAHVVVRFLLKNDMYKCNN